MIIYDKNKDNLSINKKTNLDGRLLSSTFKPLISGEF